MCVGGGGGGLLSDVFFGLQVNGPITVGVYKPAGGLQAAVSTVHIVTFFLFSFSTL